MEEFFYATVETATVENDESDRLYRTFYDQDKVRFQLNTGEGEIEFSQ